MVAFIRNGRKENSYLSVVVTLRTVGGKRVKCWRSCEMEGRINPIYGSIDAYDGRRYKG